MDRICAWCGTGLGRTPGAVGGADGAVSHGICDDCRRTMTGELGVDLRLFLESLDAPVLLVDGDVVVRDANTGALRHLGRDADAVHGRFGGDVFDCSHASDPGGCGRTIHCSGCVLRHTVEDTHQTGRSHFRVPATLEPDGPDGPEAIRLLVTTTRVGDRVLLRIDAPKDGPTDA